MVRLYEPISISALGLHTLPDTEICSSCLPHNIVPVQPVQCTVQCSLYTVQSSSACIVYSPVQSVQFSGKPQWGKRPGNPFLAPIPHSTLLHCTLLYCTVLYCTVLYSTALYSTGLYSTALYSNALYSTALYSTALYCTVLYCTALYCTALYHKMMNWLH